MAKTVVFHEYGGPEVLRLADLPVGEPGPGEVRIGVQAIGLNRAEALFRAGVYIEQARSFPGRLGAECSGVIEAVGLGVTGFAPGDAISTVPQFSYNDYAVYAEQAIVPASAVVHRPHGLDAVGAAAVWMPYLTAYSSLVETAGVRPGDTVALNAASSSAGLALIDVANHLGLRPIALTRTAEKRDALLKHGAAEVIVTDEEDPPARLLRATGGRGVELVLDAVAGPGVTDLARAVAPGGMLLVYGGLSGQPTPYPGLTLGLPALNMRSFTVLETLRDPERLRRGVAFVAAGVRSGAFRPVVDCTFALADAADAHRYLESNAQVGKVVLTVAE